MQRINRTQTVDHAQPVRPATADDRRGTLTVEFALVANIIFVLFFAGLELTSLNLMRHSAGNASYEAARKGIVPGATVAQAEQEARRLLDAVGASTNVTVNVADDGNKVTVTIAIPVDQNSWGLSQFSSGLVITKSCTLSRSM